MALTYFRKCQCKLL